MNDDQFFLANAYLDGELTADERAIAEADPEVMAAVEELRALQAMVRDVEPVSDARRDSAIAAAMARFPAVASVGADVRERDADAPIPFAPPRRYARYLAVAAGVLGVGLLGVALVNVGTGGGDDSASDEPAEEPAAEEPAEARLTEDDTFATDGDATEEMATSELPAEEPASEPAMDAADDAVSEPADEPAEEPAEEPATGAPETDLERPELLPDQVLTTPEEVGSFGTGLLEQQQAGTLPPTPNHACPIENVLGRAEYLADGEVTWLLVAVDEPARIVLGFAEDTCDFVVDGPLYLP